MPYADPDKRRAAARNSQRKRRANAAAAGKTLPNGRWRRMQSLDDPDVLAELGHATTRSWWNARYAGNGVGGS